MHTTEVMKMAPFRFNKAAQTKRASIHFHAVPRCSTLFHALFHSVPCRYQNGSVRLDKASDTLDEIVWASQNKSKNVFCSFWPGKSTHIPSLQLLILAQ
jgi:hypothetical protein